MTMMATVKAHDTDEISRVPPRIPHGENTYCRDKNDEFENAKQPGNHLSGSPLFTTKKDVCTHISRPG